MKLTQMESFLAVADSLSFTAAAKSLFLSQPALSKQIAQLEQELGVRLLLRDNRRVELTEAGQALAEDVRDLMARMASSVERVRQLGRPSPSVLRIGCFDGVVNDDFLPAILERLHQLSPDTRPALTRYSLGALPLALAEDQADLIFTLDFALPQADGFLQRRVCARQAAILYAKTHPLAVLEHPTPADFNGQIFLAIDEPQFRCARQNQLHVLKLCGIVPGETVLVPNMLTLISYLELGMGLAVLHDRVAVLHGDRLLAWPLPGQAAGPNVVAVWRRQPSAPLVDALMAKL